MKIDRRGLITGAAASAAYAALSKGADAQIPRRLVLSGSKRYFNKVVATKTHLATVAGGTAQAMARMRHRAADNITALQLVYYNGWITQTTCVETPSGGTCALTSGIEYNGNFAQVKYSGIAQGSIASGGIIVSDVCSLPFVIPKGAFFYSRMWFNNPTGKIPSQQPLPESPTDGAVTDLANGEAVTYGAVVTDQTLGGTVTDSNGLGQVWVGPAAIIAPVTTVPSVYLLGDSRTVGIHDHFTDNTGDTGQTPRSVGPYFGYINGGISGGTAQNWIAQANAQKTLIGYCTHCLNEFGEADIAAFNRTAPQVTADLASLWTIVQNAGAKPSQATLVCESTSTDGWITTGNQTTVASNGVRNTVNTNIRTSPPSGGYYEFADAIETARGSGIFKVPGGGLAYTIDGIHENPAGNGVYKAAGIIGPGSFF